MKILVYDCYRADHSEDFEPIGSASSEEEALALVKASWAGSGSTPTSVEVERLPDEGPEAWFVSGHIESE